MPEEKKEAWVGDPKLLDIVKFNKDANLIGLGMLEIDNTAKILDKGREALHYDGYIAEKLQEIEGKQTRTIIA